MGRVYTSAEIERLHQEFEKGTPLTDVGRILDRSPYGILNKVRSMAKSDPGRWDSARVAEYRQQYYQEHPDKTRGMVYKGRERGRERRMYASIRGAGRLGYEIGKISRYPTTISIELPGDDIDMPTAVTDFRNHVQEALLSAKMQALYDGLQVNRGERGVVISFDPAGIDERRLSSLGRFLKAYASSLERERSG